MSTLGEDYLLGNGGQDAVWRYHDGLTRRERIGQAFFNALSPEDQRVLCGTVADPFHYNDNKCVEDAVGYLLDLQDRLARTV